MKPFLNEIMQSAAPKFSLFIELFNKPVLALTILTPTVIVAPVVSLMGACITLTIFFIADFVTGLMASYWIWQAKEDKSDTWFFGKGEGFSSDKFKKMFVKMIVYGGAPLIVYNFQKTFLIKNLKYSTISDAEIDITTCLILIFCLNEGFSIFHENLPKCGFNLWERIKKMIGFYKEVKNEIKE